MAGVPPAVALGLLAFLGWFLVAYFLSTFRYRVSADHLEMRWMVLNRWPIATRRIRLENIRDVRLFELRDFFCPGYGFGGCRSLGLIGNAVVIILKRRVWFAPLVKRVYVCPENPHHFIAQIQETARDGE